MEQTETSAAVVIDPGIGCSIWVGTVVTADDDEPIGVGSAAFAALLAAESPHSLGGFVDVVVPPLTVAALLRSTLLAVLAPRCECTSLVHEEKFEMLFFSIRERLLLTEDDDCPATKTFR